MNEWPVDSADTHLIVDPRWADLGVIGQYSLLVLTLLVPLGLIVWLCRYELRLIARLPALGLLSLRLSVLVVIWCAVVLQPQLSALRIEETPSRVRIAVDLSTSMNVADPHYNAQERADLARVLGRTDVDAITRKQIVAKILSPQGLNLLERLAARHRIEIVGFDRGTTPLSAPQLLGLLSDNKITPDVVGTDLDQPLRKISSRRDQPLLGIILFSDGRHNVGVAPYERAEELGNQKVPIFPVVIGSEELPSDLAIVAVHAPLKAFQGTTVTFGIDCEVTKMPAQEMTVEMQIGTKPIRPEHRQAIWHDGKDRKFPVTMHVPMDEVGTHVISIKAISKLGQEITLANNVAERVIRVTDDKVKVLLVDGEARWEYQYLANALLRDPKVAVERVVFSQPRIGALKGDQLDAADLAKTKLPEAKADRKDVDPLLDYDCIILGDVSPEQLPSADRKRLQQFVSERGGTLILVAGKRYLPLAYTKADDADADPLVKILPITEPRELNKETGFTLDVTDEGKQRPFLSLEPDKPGTWPDLPKHYWGVVGTRKPGASILLTAKFGAEPSAKSDKDTGILVQQNYGLGRVLFVGIDSTWRWRFRVGDVYHHRFWGQLARWSGEDKLLPAGNRFIRYGPMDPAYDEDKEVELAVRLHDTLPPLTDLAKARAKLFRKNADGTERLVVDVPLSKHPWQPHRLEAKVSGLSPGMHRMELDIPQYREQIAEPSDKKDGPVKGGDLFLISPRKEPEMFDLSTNFDVMQNLADKSGGTLCTPKNVEEILERLVLRMERTESRDDSKPWEDRAMVWWMLGLLLGLLTVEWGWRKWLDLA